MTPYEAAGLLVVGIAGLVFCVGVWAFMALLFALLGAPPVAS